MKMTWLKPGAWGLVIGSILTMVVGFGWGGWMTSAGAESMASQRSNAAVVTALVPVCLEKSRIDPSAARKLAELEALTSSGEQVDAVIRDGWATIGSGEANRDVAEACASQLVKVATR
jgi:hypothetical protein